MRAETAYAFPGLALVYASYFLMGIVPYQANYELRKLFVIMAFTGFFMGMTMVIAYIYEN